MADMLVKLYPLPTSPGLEDALRAKGIVSGKDGFIHFDYVPGEPDVRSGSAVPTGRLCVIGAKINEDALKKLFML